MAEVTTATVLRRMGGRFRPYRWQVAGSILMSFTRIGLGVAAPLLLQRVIDDALPARDVAPLTVLCALMAGAGLLNSGLAAGQVALNNWVGQRITTALRVEVYDHARSQPLRFYSEQGQSEIQTRVLNDVDGADRFVTVVAQDAIAQTASLVAAAVAMLMLSWPLALASFALAALLSLLNQRFARRRRALAADRQRQVSGVLRFVAENLSPTGVVVARTLCRTAQQRERFVELSTRLREVTFRQRVIGAYAYSVIGASLACVPPMIYLLSGTLVTGVSVGAVVVLAILQMRLSDPIERLLQLSASLQTSVAMFERVFLYLDLPEVEGDTVASAGEPPDLSVRGLSYGYDEDLVLDDVSLDFPAGSVTVIAGSTGSGKSTLGLILAGLLPPPAGQVRPGTAELRRIVALTPQHTALFQASLRENLLFANPEAGPAELAEAAEVACLPASDGWESAIGQDGHQLSGGERQRLGIARTLLTPARVLIFDEATSALDALTADRVHEALRAHCRGRTLIIIAHRIPRLEPGDRVVVMERGRVVEAGTHGELSTYGGAYAALLDTQRGQAWTSDSG
ncbi:ABC transporter ATP-binding protein [Nonomuraea typhae]|uniref:ABC transporter ATP-binding protein n=1 Tax=Nonomuraea typhae TaxID=2603600 RepID=UPI0015E1E36A|nr:ABC transporter ATP-binding protein [Nonomuraea typhae]